MKYVIYGAGQTAQIAYDFLGELRIECFATSASERLDDYNEKPVISYDELLELNDNEHIIVIASEKYWEDMERSLKNDGVKNYFVFHEIDVYALKNFYPQYIIWQKTVLQTYTQILSRFGIRRYKKIAIYGTNYALPYLISEIEMQCGTKTVDSIVVDSNSITTFDLSRTVGIEVCGLDSIWNSVDCLVLNCRRNHSDIFDVLETREHLFDVLDIFDFDFDIPEFQHPELKRFKNSHLGERCFIVGNGPSLKIEDLEKLYVNGEITFAFNMIYKIFDQTLWRPTYYGISDGFCYCDCIDHLDFECEAKFLTDEYHRLSDKYIDDVYYFHYNAREYAPQHPKFSEDITKNVFWGKSVIYDIGLQFAAYMGFKTIILIGVDHNFKGKIADDRNHFIKDYYLNDDVKEKYNRFSFEKEKIDLAFESAKIYCEKHGIEVINATRGGNLEVFRRENFDGLF